MKHLLIALQFLTILPIRIRAQINGTDYGKSLIFFPAVGLLIGLVLALTACGLSFLQPMVLSIVILAVSAFITGGIHLDGFADTCDAFYGGKTKEKVLEILRDPRLGVMGVIGLVLLLLLKFSILTNISQPNLWKALVTAAVFSRWSQALWCYGSKYARHEGKAKHFIGHSSLYSILMGGILSFAVILFFFNLRGLLIFTVSLIPQVLFVSYVKLRIGGMTGDTIGAVSEIAEVSALLFVLVL